MRRLVELPGEATRVSSGSKSAVKTRQKPGRPSPSLTNLVELIQVTPGDGPARLLGMRPAVVQRELRSWLDKRNPKFGEHV